MKKKIYAIIITLIVMTSITTMTVLAKTLRSDWVEEKMKKGYTEADAYGVLAIMVLSDENVSALYDKRK